MKPKHNRSPSHFKGQGLRPLSQSSLPLYPPPVAKSTHFGTSPPPDPLPQGLTPWHDSSRSAWAVPGAHRVASASAAASRTPCSQDCSSMPSPSCQLLNSKGILKLRARLKSRNSIQSSSRDVSTTSSDLGGSGGDALLAGRAGGGGSSGA